MADVLSLKWIEGNDTIVIEGTTVSLYDQDVEPTFNVDNPVLWGPLSVISGLASGYCERRAVLNPEFITGTTTANNEQQDVIQNWYDDSASRDAIVANCINNLAAGSSGDHDLFKDTTNVYFNPIGTAGVSNYMVAMDNAITALVSGVSVYVNQDGEPFESQGVTPFSGLAAAASIAAAVGADPISAILLPVSEGGSNFNAAGAPALPVEWAKERKWMLEQLRFTGGKYATMDSPWAYNNISSTLSPVYGSGMYVSYYTGRITSRDSNSLSETTTLVNHNITSADFLTFAETNSAVLTANTTSDRREIYKAPYQLKINIRDASLESSARVAVFLTDSLDYNARYADYAFYNRNNSYGIEYVSTTATAIDSQAYCVISGGTLYVPYTYTEGGSTYNVEPYVVAVESGGIVSMTHSSAIISSLWLTEGASIYPYLTADTTTAFRYARDIAHNFMAGENDFMNAPGDNNLLGRYITANTTYPTADTAINKKLIITSGATVTANTNTSNTDYGNAYISNGKLIIGAGVSYYNIQVDSGGVVDVGKGAAVDWLEVFAGGSVNLVGNDRPVNDTYPTLTSIGTLHLHERGGANITGNCRICIDHLELHDSATLSIASNVFHATSEFRSAIRIQADIYHFCTFGLKGSSIQLDTCPFDWEGMPVISSGGSVYTMLGQDDAATGSNSIKTYATNGYSEMGSRLNGVCWVGNTSYTSIEYALSKEYPSSTYIHYGARVAAKNRGVFKDHYPDFYIRQSATPEEIESVTPTT